MSAPLVALLSMWLAAAAAPPPSQPPRTLVFCAPGFPGSTAEAQPTMDAFVRFAAAAAGWQPGSLEAVYHGTESEGVERLKQADAVLALVTLPFYAKYRTELGLTPRLRVVRDAGDVEAWALVVRKGSVTASAGLDGWEVVGVPGFAPDFVRGPILGGWGPIPATTRIVFTARVPSALLKAANGQKLAVLVDSEQAAALPRHPNASDLEIVARSKPLPGSLVCTVSGRGSGRDVEALLKALPDLEDRAGGKDTLASLRMRRFEPVDAVALDAVLGAKPPQHPR